DEEFKTFTDYSDPQHAVMVGDDNFKLGYGWFGRSLYLVDSGASRLQEGTREDESEAQIQVKKGPNGEFVDPTPQRKGRPGDLAFRSMPAHAQTRYAASLEKASILDVSATFGEVAKAEWSKALDEWKKFGEYRFMSHNRVWKNGKLVHEPIHVDDV